MIFLITRRTLHLKNIFFIYIKRLERVQKFMHRCETKKNYILTKKTRTFMNFYYLYYMKSINNLFTYR